MNIDSIKNFGGKNIENIYNFLDFVIDAKFQKSDIDKILKYLSDAHYIVNEYIKALELVKEALLTSYSDLETAFEEEKYDLMLLDQVVLQTMLEIKKYKKEMCL